MPIKKPEDKSSLSDYIETLRREYGLNVTIGTWSKIIFHGIRPVIEPKKDEPPITTPPNRKPN